MKFFMKKENVDQYIDMVKGYDSSWVINRLKTYLPKGATLLELGMGPGNDLQILAKDYKVVGSDNSNIFLERFNRKQTGIETLHLDAINLNTDRRFDCIYSNKVLHHLTKSEFIQSIENQFKILNPKGILFMTLWKGEHREEIMFNGEIRFTYYLEDDIKQIINNKYTIRCLENYAESDEDDSLLIVLEKK